MGTRVSETTSEETSASVTATPKSLMNFPNMD